MSRILPTLLAAAYAEQCQEDAPLMQVPHLAHGGSTIDPMKIDLTQTDVHLEPALYQLAKENAGPLSQDIQDVLNVIDTQIDSLVSLLADSHAEDQSEMARAYAAVDTCNSVAATEEQTKTLVAGDAMSSAGASHNACRDIEVSKHAVTVSDCNAFKGLVNAKKADPTMDCMKAIPAIPDGYPLQTAASIPETEAFVNCMENIHQWASDLQTAKDRQAACGSSYEAYKSQIIQCRKDQEQFEANYCVYKAHSDEVCGALDTCHENTSRDAESTCAAISAEVASRKTQHHAGQKIKCLAKTLLSGKYSSDLSECDNLPDEGGIYDIPCPVAAKKAECHRVTDQPGDEAWATSFYSQESWIDVARNDIGSSESIISDVLSCPSPEAVP